MLLMRVLIVIFASSLAGIAAYLLLSDEEDTQIVVRPPVTSGGFVEFTLIDRGYSKTVRTGDERHWVLRFPRTALVETPEQRETATGAASDWLYQKGFLPNTFLRFYLDAASLKLLPATTGHDPRDVIAVSVGASFEVYGSGHYEKGVRSWSSLYDAMFNLRCAKDSEIAEGLFLLRKRTDAEMQQVRAAHGDVDFVFGT